MTLVLARHVLPLDSDCVLNNYGVAFANGVIVDIMPRHELLAKYPSFVVIDRSDCVLMPGFVNTHTHLGMSVLRGFADDKRLKEWLSYIWPVETHFNQTDDSFIRVGVQLGSAEAIRGGTTCVADMYYKPEVTGAVLKQAGLRGLVGFTLSDFALGDSQSLDECFREGDQLAQHKDKLVRFTAAPHAPYTASLGTYRRAKAFAKTHKVPVLSHLHETKKEVADSVEKVDNVPAVHLQEVLDRDFLAVHFVAASDDDIRLLAQKGVSVAHCPTSNLKLASGVARVSEMIKRGVNVALGTDSTASNNALDMFREMRLAALLAKGVHTHDASSLDALTVLRMATINGARALKLNSRTGSLTIGKDADIIAVSLTSLELTPIYDVVSHLVYAACRNDVNDVWVCSFFQFPHSKCPRLNGIGCVGPRSSPDVESRVAEFRRGRN
ncbi:MAG: hypothetical protein MHM6MM_000693 [Cercozoa sp. M6MM]